MAQYAAYIAVDYHFSSDIGITMSFVLISLRVCMNFRFNGVLQQLYFWLIVFNSAIIQELRSLVLST